MNDRFKINHRSLRVPSFWIVVLLSLAISIFFCEPSLHHQKPRLVVMVVVDQMRADYLDRFSGNFDGGLQRFLQRGLRFTNVNHDHAATQTAVGHAVLASGELPSHNGIIGNYWFDHVLKKRIYACEDSSYRILDIPNAEGRSPEHLLVPSLGDIAKSLDNNCRVVSIAQKDRAAILMGGHHPDAALWFYDSKGKFVTSSYYADTLPAWVDSFNSSGYIESFADSIWTKALPNSAYSNRESIDFFPHRLDSGARPVGKDYFYSLSASPFGDALTLELARRAIRRYSLGADNYCDFLLLSCSAADYIGHEFGPDSPEIEDYYVRLDRMLDGFFANLDSLVGPDHYLAILASDHGVMPTPESLVRKGIKASRLSSKIVNSTIDSSLKELGNQVGLEDDYYLFGGNQIFLDKEKVKSVGLTLDSLENVIASKLKPLPFIEDVYTASELTQENTPDRPYYGLFKNCFNPDRSPNLYLRFPENTLISSDATGTGHGSPYTYDNHVPIVFMGMGIEPGTFDDSVRTVDVAPSILSYLGINYNEQSDGRSILPYTY